MEQYRELLVASYNMEMTQESKIDAWSIPITSPPSFFHPPFILDIPSFRLVQILQTLHTLLLRLARLPNDLRLCRFLDGPVHQVKSVLEILGSRAGFL